MNERALSMAARLEVQDRIKDMGRPPVKDTEREAAALILELQSRLEELNQKVEELEKDAARYRWLSNEASNKSPKISVGIWGLMVIRTAGALVLHQKMLTP